MDFKFRIIKIFGNFRVFIFIFVFRFVLVFFFQYGGGLFGNWYVFLFYVLISVFYMIDLINKICIVFCQGYMFSLFYIYLFSVWYIRYMYLNLVIGINYKIFFIIIYEV